jgi:DNA-binding CsgD family transcriptional regulator
VDIKNSLKISVFDLLSSIGNTAKIIDSSYNILWIHDPDMDSTLNLIGSRCYSIIAGRHSPCKECPAREVINTKKSTFILKRDIDKKGRKRFREIRAFPVFDDLGEVGNVVQLSFEIKRGKKAHNYQIQNYNNLKKAIQNLSKITVVNHYSLPDYNKPLSIREFEILHLASYGLSNPQMADLLSISAHTVKSHFDHIFNKLGVNNRTMAVLWAARQGFNAYSE